MRLHNKVLLFAVLLLMGVGNAIAHGGRGYSGHKGFHHGKRGHFSGRAHYHGSRGHFSLNISPFWGWPSSRHYYYSQPSVIVVPPPVQTVYIEQQPSQEVTASQYWHYCDSAKAYYPYVRECPDGWLRVLPQPEK